MIPLPEPVGTFYVDERTGILTQYRRAPAVLTDGDALLYDAAALAAVRRQALAEAYGLSLAAIRSLIDKDTATPSASDRAPGEAQPAPIPGRSP